MAMEMYMEAEQSIKDRNFLWLALLDKILSWDSCQKRACQGKGRCTMCKTSDESADDLLIQCPFATELWSKVLKLANGKGNWTGESISACFEGWYKGKSVKEHRALPCFVVLALWISRNEMTFQGKEILPIQICHQIR
jgi:hypothetical protein